MLLIIEQGPLQKRSMRDANSGEGEDTLSSRTPPWVFEDGELESEGEESRTLTGSPTPRVGSPLLQTAVSSPPAWSPTGGPLPSALEALGGDDALLPLAEALLNLSVESISGGTPLRLLLTRVGVDSVMTPRHGEETQEQHSLSERLPSQINCA